MKIGLNGQLLSNPNPAGPEVFASRLYKTMVSTDSQNDYVLYLEDKAKTELIDQVIRSNPKLEVVILRKVLSWTQISLAIELIRNPVDVFFTPIHTIPGLTSIVTLGKFRPVTMIHGLEYKVNKEYENKHIKKLLHPLILFWTTQVSRKIVVPSQATRDALIRDKFLNVKPDKISVIPEGVDKGFFSKDEILWMAFNSHSLFWFFGWVGALLTTFYMVRLFTTVFYGKPHQERGPLHDAPPLMALTLIILSLLSLIG